MQFSQTTILSFPRYVLSLSVAVLLGGCGGGSQPPIGTPGAMAQTASIDAHVEAHVGREASWMLPGARSGALIYSDGAVYSYPTGKRVGVLKVARDTGLCSDKVGNVYVTAWTSSSGESSIIYKFAHGATKPSSMLSEQGGASSCSIDSTTGNLAVSNFNGTLAVFQEASHNPHYYNAPAGIAFVAYDSRGNLFASEHASSPDLLMELPKGSSTFTEIVLNSIINFSSIQWVNGSLIAAGWKTLDQGVNIYQISISGGGGQVALTSTLNTRDNRSSGNQFLVHGKRIIGPYHGFNEIAFWRYPRGGEPIRHIGQSKTYTWGLAFSAAPHS